MGRRLVARRMRPTTDTTDAPTEAGRHDGALRHPRRTATARARLQASMGTTRDHPGGARVAQRGHAPIQRAGRTDGGLRPRPVSTQRRRARLLPRLLGDMPLRRWRLDRRRQARGVPADRHGRRHDPAARTRRTARRGRVRSRRARRSERGRECRRGDLPPLRPSRRQSPEGHRRRLGAARRPGGGLLLGAVASHPRVGPDPLCVHSGIAATTDALIAHRPARLGRCRRDAGEEAVPTVLRLAAPFKVCERVSRPWRIAGSPTEHTRSSATPLRIRLRFGRSGSGSVSWSRTRSSSVTASTSRFLIASVGAIPLDLSGSSSSPWWNAGACRTMSWPCRPRREAEAYREYGER